MRKAIINMGAVKTKFRTRLALRSRTHSRRRNIVEQLTRITNFRESEVKTWYRLFYADCPDGLLTEPVFVNFYVNFFQSGDEGRKIAMAKRIFHAFDRDGSGTVDFREYLTGMSALLRGSVVEKLKWAFNMYDLDGNGEISRLELHNVLKPPVQASGRVGVLILRFVELLTRSFDGYPTTSRPEKVCTRQKLPQLILELRNPEATLDDLAALDRPIDRLCDRVFATLDKDRDGKLQIREFVEGVRMNPRVLCLSDEEELLASLTQLMPAVGETRNGEEDGGVAIRTSEGEHKNTSTLADYITVPLDYNNRSRPTTSAIDVDCTMYVLKLGPFLEKEMSDTNAREEFVEPPMVLPGGQVIIMKKYSLYAPCLMKLHNFPHDQQFCNVHIMIMGGVKASWNAMEFWPVRDKPVLMNMQTVRSVFRVDQVDYVSFAGSSSSPQNTCIYQKATCDYQGSEDCLRTNLRCSEAENQADPVCIKCNNFGGVCSLKPTSNCSSVLKKVSAGVVFVTNLELRLKLTRRLGYHFLQTYIPSVSVVGMSWVSFWIDPASAPARTGLGVTTVLTMVTLSGKVKPAPDLNYIRAIDVWLLGCKLFVILALLEYACVNFTVSSQKREEMLVNVPKPPSTTERKSEVTHSPQEEHGNETTWNDKLVEVGRKLGPCRLDHVSRVLFPAAFVVFVCSYFVAYIY
ncbi:hypothetical protein Bbelb_217460 [Branchiostoma belcheri]|nr:hypothetical protein Bbelb_217460 [Branchiostoma belcheri]